MIPLNQLILVSHIPLSHFPFSDAVSTNSTSWPLPSLSSYQFGVFYSTLLVFSLNVDSPAPHYHIHLQIRIRYLLALMHT
jgi:hypothetical protein